MLSTRTITIRGVSDAVLKTLRSRSQAQRRSLNSELLAILDGAAAEASARQPTRFVRESPSASYQPAGSTAPEPSTVPHDPRKLPANLELLQQVDRGVIARVCRQYHVTWLAVFGSRARSEAVPESDVDVVVDFAPGMTPGLGIVAVGDALAPAFAGAKVDLVTRRGLRPGLREQVLAEAVTLYGA